MKSFEDFLTWTEQSGLGDEIAADTGALVAEAMEGITTLSPEQVKAVYQVSALVSGRIAMGYMEAYHRWANKQG